MRLREGCADGSITFLVPVCQQCQAQTVLVHPSSQCSPKMATMGKVVCTSMFPRLLLVEMEHLSLEKLEAQRIGEPKTADRPLAIERP